MLQFPDSEKTEPAKAFRRLMSVLLHPCTQVSGMKPHRLAYLPLYQRPGFQTYWICIVAVSISLIVRQRAPAFVWSCGAGQRTALGWWFRRAGSVDMQLLCPSSPHTHCSHAADISLFSTHCPHTAVISLFSTHIPQAVVISLISTHCPHAVEPLTKICKITNTCLVHCYNSQPHKFWSHL